MNSGLNHCTVPVDEYQSVPKKIKIKEIALYKIVVGKTTLIMNF